MKRHEVEARAAVQVVDREHLPALARDEGDAVAQLTTMRWNSVSIAELVH